MCGDLAVAVSPGGVQGSCGKVGEDGNVMYLSRQTAVAAWLPGTRLNRTCIGALGRVGQGGSSSPTLPSDKDGGARHLLHW
mmetsp:Transcript_15952/g.34530  ORF Transcript_15952/g.34530 Transcript_15952/m.34530 type:complete len:81 (+) Transcript_15952:17-259(+)